MGWTNKMRGNRHPNTFTLHGDFRRGTFCEFVETPHVETPQNASTIKSVKKDRLSRETVLAEIEKRCKAGEELSKITDDIASREEVRKVFSYFINNNLDLSQIFQNWYNAKQKNASTVAKIEGRA